jgi:hypothetical protein
MRPRVEDLMVFSSFGSYDPLHPQRGRVFRRTLMSSGEGYGPSPATGLMTCGILILWF